jgi:hypothetical protein
MAGFLCVLVIGAVPEGSIAINGFYRQALVKHPGAVTIAAVPRIPQISPSPSGGAP